MRNLDECQAEVFRRSEQRIRKRRRRRRQVLAACVPLALVLLWAAFLPGSADRPEPEQTLADAYLGAVAVSGNGISVCHTGEEEVRKILSLLEEITGVSEASVGDGLVVREDGDGENWTEAYRITITYEDGTSTEYLLSGSVLKDPITGQQVEISEKDSLALRTALGLEGRG